MEVFLGRQRRKKHIHSTALLIRTVFYYYLFNGGKKGKKKKSFAHTTLYNFMRSTSGIQSISGINLSDPSQL